MPSTRPCAAFEPISPDFDLHGLVESTPNFEWVVRIHCDMIDHQGLENFEKLVLIHVILGGKPLVVEGYESRLDKWTFALQWLRDNCGSKVEHARDLTKKTNVPLSIGHYLNNMALLTNQWTPRNYKDPARQRMYLKDIDCPQLWQDKLTEVLPPGLFYFNESTGDVGGFGAVDEKDPTRPGLRKGRGIAKAGDLMSSLPKEMRAENIMCYIGHEGTYTPAHREMCASLGQNLMVEASNGAVEDGKLTKLGSSIWFMTETKERKVVSEYWLSKLGHDIEIEGHFAQINAWKNAPFKTYVVEQRPGDFILIPPLAPHQVWNRGTRTMKVAWNRTTVETLELGLREALPRARMVCRDEQYKNKAIVYYTLNKYSKLLRAAEKFKQKALSSRSQAPNDVKVRQLERDFRRLHHLFTEILVSESYVVGRPEPKAERLTYDSNITCSYCRCNIFNRFLTCPNCVEQLPNNEEDTYDICLECYAVGRSCACISKLRWVEQWPWAELTQKHDQWRHQILQYEGRVTERSPVSLKSELGRRGGRKTLAQICQAELARRPFHDVRKLSPVVTGDDRLLETQVDANGNVKKKRKIVRSENFVREHARCHTDCHWEPKWKQASCTTCDKNFCYGILFRAYDMLPQDVLADPQWQCPSCLNICGCRSCKKRAGYRPYLPAGTNLGHDTKAVADPRSVESLVDFSYSNIGWIQKAGDDNEDNTYRLDQRRREAEAEKAKDPAVLGDHYAEKTSDRIETNLLRLAEFKGIPIDPALAVAAGSPSSSADADDGFDEYPEVGRQKQAVGASPTPSRYFVPEGGVFRDLENAYEQTEAITYDYPDPDVGRQVMHPVDDDSSALRPGDAPPVVDEPSEVEMVAAKRKRARIDEGDRSFVFKKGASHHTKPIAKAKERRSLIVQLRISLSKLVSVETTTPMATQAMNGAHSAPVISSDLRALNAADGHPLTVPKRNRGTEHATVDKDDDFTPGRYRDRRKGVAAGGALPHPDADITRRQTRTHNVHYEERSEGEFEEMLSAPTDRDARPKAKVVRLDDVDSDFDAESATSDDLQLDDADTASRPTVESPHALSSPSKESVHSTRGGEAHEAFSGQENGESSSAAPPAREPAPKGPNGRPAPVASESLAQAQENRQAKMVAIEWSTHDVDDLSDAWSIDSFMGDAEPAAEPAKIPVVSRQTASEQIANGQTAREKAAIEQAAREKTTKQKTATEKAGKEKTDARPDSKVPTPPLPIKEQTTTTHLPSLNPTSRGATTRALASEWVDSEDSDDGGLVLQQKPKLSHWGPGHSGVTARVASVKPGAKRPRGRPPKRA